MIGPSTLIMPTIKTDIYNVFMKDLRWLGDCHPYLTYPFGSVRLYNTQCEVLIGVRSCNIVPLVVSKPHPLHEFGHGN